MALRSSISAALRFPFAAYCSASLMEAVVSLAYRPGQASTEMAAAKARGRHKLRGRQRQRDRAWGIAFPFSRKWPLRIEADLVLMHQVVESGPADSKQLCCF